jgi:hypothetical protein
LLFSCSFSKRSGLILDALRDISMHANYLDKQFAHRNVSPCPPRQSRCASRYTIRNPPPLPSPGLLFVTILRKVLLLGESAARGQESISARFGITLIGLKFGRWWISARSGGYLEGTVYLETVSRPRCAPRNLEAHRECPGAYPGRIETLDSRVSERIEASMRIEENF